MDKQAKETNEPIYKEPIYKEPSYEEASLPKLKRESVTLWMYDQYTSEKKI